MNIFFPKEHEIEKRVSLTLETAEKFLKLGLKIFIEKSFSEHIGTSDEDFAAVGVKIVSRDEGFLDANLICSVRNLQEEEIDKISDYKIYNQQYNYQCLLQSRI